LRQDVTERGHLGAVLHAATRIGHQDRPIELAGRSDLAEDPGDAAARAARTEVVPEARVQAPSVDVFRRPVSGQRGSGMGIVDTLAGAASQRKLSARTVESSAPSPESQIAQRTVISWEASAGAELVSHPVDPP